MKLGTQEDCPHAVVSGEQQHGCPHREMSECFLFHTFMIVVFILSRVLYLKTGAKLRISEQRTKENLHFLSVSMPERTTDSDGNKSKQFL